VACGTQAVENAKPLVEQSPDREGFVSFGSFVTGDTPGDEKQPTTEDIDRAVSLCNLHGVRLIEVDDNIIPHIWRELDTDELRAAIRLACPDAKEIRHLDEPTVPARYRSFIPALLREKRVTWRVPQDAIGISWEEWKARMLNDLFLKYGATKRPGRFTAAMIRQSEQHAEQIRKNKTDKPTPISF
jgi:hypothetical protein